jgi:hypothetical protein
MTMQSQCRCHYLLGSEYNRSKWDKNECRARLQRDDYRADARRFAIAARTLSQPAGCSPYTLSFQSFR